MPTDVNCTEQIFLKDVAGHQMTVLRDDGVNRHLRFQKPGTNCMGFDVVTWPGYLCYSGDMGTYVFQRLDDMFQFFRADRRHNREEDQTLYINLSYWAEKLQAVDRCDGVKKYSADKFRESVAEWLEDRDASNELRQAVKNEVLPYADDGESVALNAAQAFEHEGRGVFQDFWEVDLTEYTYRFIWCCYALAWGIQSYDQGCEVSCADKVMA